VQCWDTNAVPPPHAGGGAHQHTLNCEYLGAFEPYDDALCIAICHEISGLAQDNAAPATTLEDLGEGFESTGRRRLGVASLVTAASRPKRKRPHGKPTRAVSIACATPLPRATEPPMRSSLVSPGTAGCKRTCRVGQIAVTARGQSHRADSAGDARQTGGVAQRDQPRHLAHCDTL
jgi:hypothetical protein